MFDDNQVLAGIKMFTNIVTRHLLPFGVKQEEEQQSAVFYGKRNITNVLTPSQEQAKREDGKFEPDLELAKRRAEMTLRSGVGYRLRGAFECYKANMQIECLRHILLALGVVCHALGWARALVYLSEQNSVLREMSKDERTLL